MRLFDMDSREDYLLDGKYKVATPSAEPIVIRSKTLMPTKDFKEWAKRIREVNPNAVVIPCDAESVSAGDIGEVSDGYHTFNQLYHQRAVLFAAIVKQNKEKAWKSWKHEDGKFCFDSNKEWFIVGVDTPEGSYTYHYEKKYWDMFDCVELEHGKSWDGHTEEDVTRLLSLPSAEAVSKYAEWLEKIIVEAETLEWLCEDTTDEEWCEKNCNYASIQAKCLRHLYEACKGGDDECV